MKSRFYVMFVQHNKDANAENRTIPSAYDDLLLARQKFHEQLGKDMKNATLDWSIGYILDNFGNKIESEYWTNIEETTEENEGGE
jgi:hypothetical protein